MEVNDIKRAQTTIQCDTHLVACGGVVLRGPDFIDMVHNGRRYLRPASSDHRLRDLVDEHHAIAIDITPPVAHPSVMSSVGCHGAVRIPDTHTAQHLLCTHKDITLANT